MLLNAVVLLAPALALCAQRLSPWDDCISEIGRLDLPLPPAGQPGRRANRASSPC